MTTPGDWNHDDEENTYDDENGGTMTDADVEDKEGTWKDPDEED